MLFNNERLQILNVYREFYLIPLYILCFICNLIIMLICFAFSECCNYLQS